MFQVPCCSDISRTGRNISTGSLHSFVSRKRMFFPFMAIDSYT